MIVNFRNIKTGALWEVDDQTPWMEHALGNKELVQITQAEANEIMRKERGEDVRPNKSTSPGSNGS